jgi:hypothetical protein
MHLVPVVVLAVEGLLNSIVFDIKNGFWFSLWMICAYFPLTYFSNKIVGFYPYTYIDWSQTSAFYWVATIIIANQVAYYGISVLNNVIKTGSGLSPKHFLKLELEGV